ncbi:hypothetical protein FJTKL_07130 [Diaporthe vaccinii]|uniref:Uncharacterized protein n=1 Tax=Diaporthe vaccinii TaxID=105482 RepID=A0ABR4EV75_9PEZI
MQAIVALRDLCSSSLNKRTRITPSRLGSTHAQTLKRSTQQQPAILGQPARYSRTNITLRFSPRILVFPLLVIPTPRQPLGI